MDSQSSDQSQHQEIQYKGTDKIYKARVEIEKQVLKREKIDMRIIENKSNQISRLKIKRKSMPENYKAETLVRKQGKDES